MPTTSRFPSPRQRLVLTPLFEFLVRYFRARPHGLDLVPTDRPVVYVGKHPRCWLYFETMVLGYFAFFAHGERPAIRVLEKRDTSLHRAPLIGLIRRNVNAMPASEDGAVEALAAGESVLLFPGGPREMFGAPDVIRWEGRRGFARIAARAGAPVVPFAIAGADRQHPWHLRVGRSATMWLPPLPLPVRLDVHFGAPMSPPRPDDAPALARFAEEVAAATQQLLAAAGQGRR
jgi:1-acyl-sn-glycerol-3-phosphate acyltransferase